jgi:hypothetical protein
MTNITSGLNQALELHLLGTLLPPLPTSSLRMEAVVELFLS